MKLIGETDRRLALRTLDLIDAILRDPFAGIGNPVVIRFELDDTSPAGLAVSRVGWLSPGGPGQPG